MKSTDMLIACCGLDCETCDARIATLTNNNTLIYELLTPDDIQRDIIDKAGADMKAFDHVNYCLAVRKG